MLPVYCRCCPWCCCAPYTPHPFCCCWWWCVVMLPPSEPAVHPRFTSFENAHVHVLSFKVYPDDGEKKYGYRALSTVNVICCGSASLVHAGSRACLESLGARGRTRGRSGLYCRVLSPDCHETPCRRQFGSDMYPAVETRTFIFFGKPRIYSRIHGLSILHRSSGRWHR